VDRARKSVPTNTGEFDARIAALQQRIDAIQLRLVDAAKKQNDFLAQTAVRELEGQKDRLSTYQVQARFALATMYDRAANADQLNKDAKPKQKLESGEEVETDEEAGAAEQTPPTGEVPAGEPPTGSSPTSENRSGEAPATDAPLPPESPQGEPTAPGPANESAPPPTEEPKR
jgi:hypothetical protein